uniref:ABC transporter domain-containing protein n=1 Tax=Globisporangium ultimum (strain ATCC 200006 / CBS 805.95 / DAOM BR144) TaxID=431595 RepID=K3XB23_GLOUD
MAQSRYRAEKTSMRSGDGSAAQPRETSLLLRDGRSTYGGGFGSTNVQEAAPSQQSAFPGSTPSTTAFHPEDAASLFSRLTFGFYKQLVVHPATPPAVSSDAKAGGSNDDDASQGVCRNDAPSIRNIQNVWPLPPQSTTAHVAKAFEDVYLVERSVWRTVRRLEKAAIVTSFVLNVVVVCCDVASPFLLYRLLVKVLTLSSKASDMEILLLLFAIYVVKQIGSHCESLARFALFKASLRLDGALQTLSLRYMLEKPCDDMGESTSSGDQELLKRVSHFSEFRNISIFLMDKGKLWMDGCGIAAYLYVLNTALENKLQVIILPVSALIAVTALLNAVETEWVSTWAEKRNRANQLLRYVFHQILQIKMNAWEEKNLAKITSARVQESQVRWRLVALSIVKLALSWTSTDAILAAIFTATSVHDERLSPLLVYSTLLLFGSMRLKITHSFPGRLESRFRVKFAVRKIENLFASKFDSKEQQTQMERDADITRELQEDSSHAQVWMRNVTLGAGSGSDTKALIHCIDLEIYSGELVIVQGKAGTGKSTLLRSFIGDASLRNGRYRLPGARSTIAFCAQDPWLQTLSVKDNILFGLPVREYLDPFEEFEDHCLWNVLRKSGLVATSGGPIRDLSDELAENGENRSTGERQLLCISRALLNPSPIVILDEAFSSLDQTQDDYIIEVVTREFQRSTVFLITHRLDQVLSFDKIMVMKDGYMIGCGEVEELIADPDSAFYEFLETTLLTQ